MKSLVKLLKQLNTFILVISLALPSPSFSQNTPKNDDVDTTLSEQSNEYNEVSTVEINNDDSAISTMPNSGSLQDLDITQQDTDITSDVEVNNNYVFTQKAEELDPETKALNEAIEKKFQLQKEINSLNLQEAKNKDLAITQFENLEFQLKVLKESVLGFKSEILRGKWATPSLGQNKLQQNIEQLENWKLKLITQLVKTQLASSEAARLTIESYFSLAFELIFIQSYFQPQLMLQPLQPLANQFSIILPEDVFLKVYPSRQLLSKNIDAMAYLNSHGKQVALRWNKSEIFAQLVSSLNVGDANKNYMPLVRCLLGMMLYSDLATTNLYLKSNDKDLVGQDLSNNALCKGVTHQDLLKTYQYEKQSPFLENEVRSYLLRSPYFFSDVLENNKIFKTIAIDGRRVTPSSQEDGELVSVKNYYPFLYLFPTQISEDIKNINSLSSDNKARILTKDELISLLDAITNSRIEYTRHFDSVFFDMGSYSGLTEKLSEIFQNPLFNEIEELNDPNNVSDLIYSSEVMFFESEFRTQVSKWSAPLYSPYRKDDQIHLLDTLVKILTETKVQTLRTTTKYLLTYAQTPDNGSLTHENIINYLEKKYVRPYVNQNEQQQVLTNVAKQILSRWQLFSTQNTFLETAAINYYNYSLIPVAKKATDIMVNLSPYELPYDKAALKDLFTESINALDNDVQKVIDDALQIPNFSAASAYIKANLELFSLQTEVTNALPFKWGITDKIGAFFGSKTSLEEFVKKQADKYSQLQMAASWFGWTTTLDEDNKQYGPSTIRNIHHSLAQDLDESEMKQIVQDYRNILRAKLFVEFRILELPYHMPIALELKKMKKRRQDCMKLFTV